MEDTILVLDHGYVKLIGSYGTDETVANAARTSYKKKETYNAKRPDPALIRYLMMHEHMGPFEFCQLHVEIKAPLFIVKQLLRHRTGSANEISARYCELPDEVYVPALSDIAGPPPKGKSKQGRDEENVLDTLTEDDKLSIQELIALASGESMKAYKVLLQMGLAPEVARLVMPANAYTVVQFTIDLRNLLHMLHLRTHRTAQLEFRRYAEILLWIAREKWPACVAAWEEKTGRAPSRSQPDAPPATVPVLPVPTEEE